MCGQQHVWQATWRHCSTGGLESRAELNLGGACELHVGALSVHLSFFSWNLWINTRPYSKPIYYPILSISPRLKQIVKIIWLQIYYLFLLIYICFFCICPTYQFNQVCRNTVCLSRESAFTKHLQKSNTRQRPKQIIRTEQNYFKNKVGRHETCFGRGILIINVTLFQLVNLCQSQYEIEDSISPEQTDGTMKIYYLEYKVW